jgi:hypothetical protein
MTGAGLQAPGLLPSPTFGSKGQRGGFPALHLKAVMNQNPCACTKSSGPFSGGKSEPKAGFAPEVRESRRGDSDPIRKINPAANDGILTQRK